MIANLFFYGVLMPALASGRMAGIVGLLDDGLPAEANGRLFAVPDPAGHFPVLVPGDGLVVGRLHRPSAAFGQRELGELDRFEGKDYVRRSIAVRLADRSQVPADAYLWRRRVAPGLIPIPHGDFARYLAETGARPLPG